MKIVHVAPVAPYNEGWGYQDNLLPKHQKLLGHEVTLIITNMENRDGKIIETDTQDYVNEYGVRVIRLSRKKYKSTRKTNIKSKLNVYDLLCQIKPDFIFFHSIQSATIFDVVKYKKKVNKNCNIVCDSHLDEYNNPYHSGIKGKIIRLIYRLRYKRVNRHITKLYGVTPLRKSYLEEFFKVPKSKTDVLIMGADDEKMNAKNSELIRNSVREKFNVGDDFLVVTGGKIDARKNVISLMKICSCIDKLKLLIFGNVNEEISEEFFNVLSNSKNIIYLGWISSDSVYDYFYASDLIVFPGSHSVLWEQACASKTPCLFNELNGIGHLNNGGNSAFVNANNETKLEESVRSLMFTEKYFKMKEVANSSATDVYLYSEIAKKSLECASIDGN